MAKGMRQSGCVRGSEVANWTFCSWEGKTKLVVLRKALFSPCHLFHVQLSCQNEYLWIQQYSPQQWKASSFSLLFWVQSLCGNYKQCPRALSLKLIAHSIEPSLLFSFSLWKSHSNAPPVCNIWMMGQDQHPLRVCRLEVQQQTGGWAMYVKEKSQLWQEIST